METNCITVDYSFGGRVLIVLDCNICGTKSERIDNFTVYFNVEKNDK